MTTIARKRRKSATKKLESAFIGILALLIIIAILFISTALGDTTHAQLIFWGVLFILSMGMLVKSADYFLETSELIGLALGLSPFVIGVTLVAMGTSLPELLTSIIAVMRGATEFTASNVVGSNISNLLLIGGVAAIVARKMKVEFDILKVDLPLLLGSTVLLILTLYDGVFDIYEGILCFTLFLIYLAYSLSAKRIEVPDKHKRIKWWVPVVFILSCIGIYAGSHYTVESVIKLSGLLGFGNTSIIALSAVALGTSLPELFVSVTAVRRGNMEMAVGNVIGSNIFNVGMVMGIPALIAPLIAPPAVILGLFFLAGATLLYIFASLDREISSFEGAMFVVLYVLFIIKLFA